MADQRKKFVAQYESGEWAMAELCRMYDISRQSGYKWVKRGQQGETEWEDRSRAAHHHPLQVAAEIEEIDCVRQAKTSMPPLAISRRSESV